MADLLFSDIEDNLSRYAPIVPLETEYLSEFQRLLEKGPAALWSDHFYPGHVTASAFVLSPQKHHVLMIFHNKLQRWLQPGGHLEEVDTSLLGAVQREVREETSIENAELIGDGIFDIDIHEIPERKNKPAHLHYDIRLLLSSHTAEYETSSEAPEISWVDLEDAQRQFDEPSLLRPIRKVWKLFS